MLNKMKKSRLGFTLVELIVVIAILAILAGVAIPVYSGYIKRANEAADYVLLDAAKGAIAAAAMEHQVDYHDIVVTLKVDDNTKAIVGFESVRFTTQEAANNFNYNAIRSEQDGFGAGVAMLSSRHTASPTLLSEAEAEVTQETEDERARAALETSFTERYFAKNLETPLKALYEKQPLIISGDDVISFESFHRDDEGNVTMTVKNNHGTATYTVSGAQIDAVVNSTYGSEMAVEELLSDVGAMVESFADTMGGGRTVAAMLTNFGFNLEEMGITEPYDEADKAAMSNAVVLAVAQGLQTDNPEATAATFTGMLGTEVGLGQLSTLLNSGDYDRMIPMGENAEQNTQNLMGMVALYAVATGFSSSSASDGWTYTDSETGRTFSSAQEYYGYVNEQIAAVASTNQSVGEKAKAIMKSMASLTNLMMDGGEFTEAYDNYVSNGKLGNDTLGFVQAMNMVSANAGSLITSGAVSDGFNSGSISMILDMILHGQNTATNP